jgi:hypothetical protein
MCANQYLSLDNPALSQASGSSSKPLACTLCFLQDQNFPELDHSIGL